MYLYNSSFQEQIDEYILERLFGSSFTILL